MTTAREDRFPSSREQVFERMSEAYVMLDHHGVVACHNTAAKVFFLGRHEDLLGQVLWKNVHSTPDFRAQCDHVLHEKVSVAFHGPVVEGGTGVHACLFPVEGGMEAYICTAEPDHLGSHRAIELVPLLAHELRSSISPLLGYVELLRTRDYPREEQQEMLRCMAADGQFVMALLDDVLDTQALESGVPIMRRVSSDVGELLRTAAATIGTTTRWPLEVRAARDLPRVNVAPERIQQVLLNLLSNARKYSPQGGPIRLSAQTIGEEVEITVQDQGLGIPPGALGQLFKRFTRVDTPDRSGITGTGLGLAIVKQIVTAHGGRIWAASPGPGQGSTFGFTLPKVA